MICKFFTYMEKSSTLSIKSNNYTQYIIIQQNIVLASKVHYFTAVNIQLQSVNR